ncbi:MAG TPA: hypothetical protein DIC42_06145 [Holosporales bacterium]|nr:hypothetical protein [Holosporales bacterium]
MKSSIFLEPNMLVIEEIIRDALSIPRDHNQCKIKYEHELKDILSIYEAYKSNLNDWNKEKTFCEEWGLVIPQKPIWDENAIPDSLSTAIIFLINELKSEYTSDDLLNTYTGTSKDILEKISCQ